MGMDAIFSTGTSPCLSSWLRVTLAALELNQKQAAKKAVLSIQVIRKILNNSATRPRHSTIRLLEKAFGPIPSSCLETLEGNSFTQMSRDQLLQHCRKLYENGGLESLMYCNLKKSKGLYWSLYNAGLRQRILIKELGVDESFSEKTAHLRSRVIKDGKRIQNWSKERVIANCKEIVEQRGDLPPAGWFQVNGMGGLVQAVYNLGLSWGSIRDSLGLKTSIEGGMVRSRNGLWWRSHSEACLSNYLHARNVSHTIGDMYPKEYAKISGRRSGQYDLKFQSEVGTWFNLEIWGDKPNGHDAEGYAARRAFKESFNASNPHFIGLHYTDCWADERLEKAIGHLIKERQPSIFQEPYDHLIQSVHWSDADELIAFCRKLATEQTDGEFPTEEWLRKRGKYKSRTGQAYNTLSVYIKTLIGGMRKLRSIIGQADVSTKKWSRDAALAALRDWHKRFAMSPGTSTAVAQRRGHILSPKDEKDGQNIAAAIAKYVGTLKDAYDELGISVEKTPRKWNVQSVLDGFRNIIEKRGISPAQLRNDHKIGKVILSPDERIQLGQLLDASSRYFSGSDEIYKILGFSPPSRKRRPKTKREVS